MEPQQPDDHPRGSHDTVAARFETQVRRTPDAIALSYHRTSLSYAELNDRADRLAALLRSKGMGRGKLVGLLADRSIELVVGIVAILKTGAAYLPIDPCYPTNRRQFMLEDGAVQVLLTQASFADAAATANVEVIFLDADLPVTASLSVDEAETVDPAYVIYTSGSTGQPKGVVVTHANVTRLFDATDNWFQFGQSDVWTLFHSTAFDFSVWELWGALLFGGRLVIVPYTVSRSPDEFHRLLRDERVTVLNQTPSAFRQLIRADETIGSADDLRNLRLVIFGGEMLEPQTLRPWFSRHGDVSPLLVNMYGITETTVHVTYKPLHLSDLDRKSTGSPIGVPIPDLQVHLLDQNLSPVSIGEVGEMYVSGPGVAQGYLNRPSLTAERFVQHPAANGARLYKTGDLARRRPDGELEFIGRCDQQVKIRGFRIELGEIETAVAAHPRVRESVVVARTDESGNQQLVAYVSTRDGKALDSKDLRDKVRETLPDYMVPAIVVTLAELPLNSNGKLDRAALPPPASRSNRISERPTVSGSWVTRIAEVWSQVLDRDFGHDDNFFDVGGNSLELVAIHAEMRQQFQIDLPITDYFQHSTVNALAQHIEKRTAVDAVSASTTSRASRQREAFARQKQLRGARP